jgi:hypothetical protein
MGVHLVGVYLIGVHLTGVHLMGAHLIGVHLTGVHLIRMYLMGVYLVGVYLMACISWRVLASGRKCRKPTGRRGSGSGTHLHFSGSSDKVILLADRNR